MMKWWGWGDEKITFPMQDKPNLWPWIKGMLGVEKEKLTPPIDRSKIQMPKALLSSSFCEEIKSLLKPEQIAGDETARLLHSYGKSFPDLLRVRRGEIRRAPDLVLYPESHDEVEKIVRLADSHGVCVIPFGGGTNIVGGVNPESEERRMVVTLDLVRMNRLLKLDPESRTATLEAGALGPHLEMLLQKEGYSLGHYPDSFEYSTLGGWLATRSAGMQSDAYGKIEDMVVALKFVSPEGTIKTLPTPASSAGPDLNQLLVGSEGTFGIITEATMRVHRTPQVKDYRGFLFKTFEDGVAAIQECIDKNYLPSLIRLQDSGETQLAFNMKSPKKGLEAWIQKPIKAILKARGYTAPCIMIVGFEGDEETALPVANGALAILKKYHAFPLGKGVGKTWSKDKFNVPYLRDYVMDYGCMADVAETATVWANVLPLYHHTVKKIKEVFATEGGKGYIGCHISHTYKTGACLYFTYAAVQKPGNELEDYYRYKRLMTESFLETGGTLSHHHAIGIEHLPWMEREVSQAGLKALAAVKKSLDPRNILNPGKLIPTKFLESNVSDVHSASSVDKTHELTPGALGETWHYGNKQPIDSSRNNEPRPAL